MERVTRHQSQRGLLGLIEDIDVFRVHDHCAHDAILAHLIRRGQKDRVADPHVPKGTKHRIAMTRDADVPRRPGQHRAGDVPCATPECSVISAFKHRDRKSARRHFELRDPGTRTMEGESPRPLRRHARRSVSRRRSRERQPLSGIRDWEAADMPRLNQHGGAPDRKAQPRTPAAAVRSTARRPSSERTSSAGLRRGRAWMRGSRGAFGW